MESTRVTLPGLDCGLCGFRKCTDLNDRLAEHPEWLERCVHLDDATQTPVGNETAAVGCGRHAACVHDSPHQTRPAATDTPWQDSLGREFDFYLEHFPEEPGPREIVLPHNPMLTREMNIQVGDVMLGRPLGMSCGCPITHCGVVMDVDQRTGVMNWCVTGPLRARQEGFKDIGYYIAEGYEGLIRESRVDLKIGMRYYFQPRMCMLQWRHSGLVNFLNRTSDGLQVRLEGLWIG